MRNLTFRCFLRTLINARSKQGVPGHIETPAEIMGCVDACLSYWRRFVETLDSRALLELFAGGLQVIGYTVSDLGSQSDLWWVSIQAEMLVAIDGMGVVGDNPHALQRMVNTPSVMFVLHLRSHPQRLSGPPDHPKIKVVPTDKLAGTLAAVSLVELWYEADRYASVSRESKLAFNAALEAHGLSWKRGLVLHGNWKTLTEAASDP
jgi:hypothetical protein